jgi:hypothetical protein
MRRSWVVILGVIAALSGTSCSHKRAFVSPPAPVDNSYMDVVPGTRLRILVPLLKEGQRDLGLGTFQSAGSTISVSASNLIGYQLSYYSAEKRRQGKVRLKFVSEETSRDGKMMAETERPDSLPFVLPQEPAFVRLVFLVRVSAADHNMAIVAAQTRDELDSLTTTLRKDPKACQTVTTTFCTWIPEGVAVRPESAQERH